MRLILPPMEQTRAPLITPVLVAGCLIIMVGFSIRASFGVFQIPIAEDFGWLRADFSMAIAIQNLAWGIGQPIFGALGEKFGDRRAIIIGAICYAAGLILSSYAITPGQHQFLEILVGFGVAGTGFGVILAVVGRAASDENRSMALAIATAAGSAGQVIGPPLAQWLLTYFVWQNVFLIFALMIIAVLLVLPMMRTERMATRTELEESLGQILRRVSRDPTYAMIFMGFFSCGYQLSFVTAHFPALHHRILRRDRSFRNTGLYGRRFNGGAWGAGNLDHRCRQHRRDAVRRIPRKEVLQEVPVGRDLYRADDHRRRLHPDTNNADNGDPVFGDDGLALVGDRAAYQRACRAYLWGCGTWEHSTESVFFSHQLGSFMGVWLGGWDVRSLWQLQRRLVGRCRRRSILSHHPLANQGRAADAR